MMLSLNVGNDDYLPKINDYQVGEQIYKSHINLVYRAVSLADGMPVVLKMPRSDRPTHQDRWCKGKQLHPRRSPCQRTRREVLSGLG
jgi:hypothetical protein